MECAHKLTQIKARFIIAVLPATFYAIMVMLLCVTLSHRHAIYKIALRCGIGERDLGFVFISSAAPLKAFPLMEWDTRSGQYGTKGDTKVKAAVWTTTSSFPPENKSSATYRGALASTPKEECQTKCKRRRISSELRESVTVTVPFRKVLNLVHSGSTNSLMGTV